MSSAGAERKTQLRSWTAGAWFALAFSYHALMFVMFARSHGQSAVQVLSHFDSNWFADIVTRGRGITVDAASESRWAFYPLYLWMTGALVKLTSLSPYLAGTIISWCSILGLCLYYRKPRAHLGPAPSHWGWFLLVFSPASVVFFTFHTESFFLLVSVVAFTELRGGRLGVGLLALFASVLTRNQGVFVAVIAVVALIAARKWSRVAATLLTYVTAQTCLWAYAWHDAGTPWAFVQAQNHWPHATSAWEVARTLWMGNETQTRSAFWVVRHLYALIWMATSVAMWRSSKVASGYSLLSSLVMFFQSTFQNAFRFSAVVFPWFFFLGEKLQRASRRFQIAVVVIWLAGHTWVTWGWLRDAWPY